MTRMSTFDPSETVTIERGENAGQTLTYANIVSGWTELGTWDGTAPLSLSVPAGGDRPAVVILQEQGPGRIVAAARLW